MKQNNATNTPFVLAVLLMLTMLPAWGNKTYGQNAQSQILGVSQAIDGTLTPPALGGLHVTFSYFNSGPTPVFLNIWAQMPGQQNSAWVAMNICLSPFNGTRLLERSISLQQLGIPDTVRVSGIMLAAQQTNLPLTTPVTPSNFNSYNCPLDSLFIFDIPSTEPAGPGGPGYLATDYAGGIAANVARGCNVPNVDLNDSAHPAVKKGYAGDFFACAPASVANSLEWLEANVPGVGSDMLSQRARLEELSGLMGRVNKGDGVNNHDMIQGKIAFIAKHHLKVKVEYLGASGDFKEDVAWLNDQYKKNQDVELDYTYVDGNGVTRSHAVVLTDLNTTGTVPQISVKDDKNQKKAGGNGEEKNLELSPDNVGRITFVRDGRECTVHNMYAESLDSTAGTFTDPNTNKTTVTFCDGDNNKKKCVGACPALNAYYDGAGNPLTMYPICDGNGKKTCCAIDELFLPGACKDKNDECRSDCPLLYRSKFDAKRTAAPVTGKCDKSSCNCVYKFAPENNKRRMIPQEQKEEGLKIYPNPVREQVNIEAVGYEGAFELQVVNVLGQQLVGKSIVLDSDVPKYSLDVSSLSNGVYFIVLRNGTQTLGGMFVKE